MSTKKSKPTKIKKNPQAAEIEKLRQYAYVMERRRSQRTEPYLQKVREGILDASGTHVAKRASKPPKANLEGGIPTEIVDQRRQEREALKRARKRNRRG